MVKKMAGIPGAGAVGLLVLESVEVTWLRFLGPPAVTAAGCIGTVGL